MAAYTETRVEIVTTQSLLMKRIGSVKRSDPTPGVREVQQLASEVSVVDDL